MSQLIFRGAKILKHTGTVQNNGQYTQEIMMRADYSKELCLEMGWIEKPDGFGAAKLLRKLHGANMRMEPNKGSLKDYRFDIAISKVDLFKHVVIMKDGEVHEHLVELRITTVDPAAHAVVANYMQYCNPGDDRGQCRVKYDAEEQGTLAETPETQEEEVTVEIDKPRGRKKAASGD